MRVTLNVDALSPVLSGIGRYCWELCQRLPLYSDIEELSYYRSDGWVQDPAALLKENYEPKRLMRWSRHLKMIQSRWILGRSLVHGPNYFLPNHIGVGVITVHDLSVFKYPETHPVARIADFEQQFSRSIKAAHHIITDSDTVRSELIEFAGVTPDKVSTVPLGIDPRFHPVTEAESRPLLSRLGLAYRGYGLCISALEPRKKIDALLEAWRRLPQNIRNRWPLVLAGPQGWLNDSLIAKIREGEEEGWLCHLGFLPEQELPTLYSSAGLFVYPSIYEGFGLPPVEAMACGTPVIVSNRSCFPEVCGEAAMFVDPEDTDSFIVAIEKGLLDDSWRNEAIRKGTQQANLYSWERCMDGTIGAYRCALKAAGW